VSCECIALINQAFERDGKNSVLESSHVINLSTGKTMDSTVRIEVSKRDSRKKERAAALIPVYCPFCGQKYDVAAS
jgi:hypothetical protein